MCKYCLLRKTSFRVFFLLSVRVCSRYLHIYLYLYLSIQRIAAALEIQGGGGGAKRVEKIADKEEICLLRSIGAERDEGGSSGYTSMRMPSLSLSIKEIVYTSHPLGRNTMPNYKHRLLWVAHAAMAAP